MFANGPQVCTTTPDEVRSARAWVEEQLLVRHFEYVIRLPSEEARLPDEDDQSEEAELIKRYFSYPTKRRELQAELMARPRGRVVHWSSVEQDDVATFGFERLLGR